jgi:hypothetical protein
LREAIDACRRRASEWAAAVTTQLAKAEIVDMKEEDVRLAGHIVSVHAAERCRGADLICPDTSEDSSLWRERI